MNKVKLGYYTLKDATHRWNCTVQDILEWGANGILKIHIATEIRGSRTPLIVPTPGVKDIIEKTSPNGSGNQFIPKPIQSHSLGRMLGRISPIFIGSRYLGFKDLAIIEDEVHRFEQEQNFQIITEEDYPRELQIALEVWRKVFSQGLTPLSPTKTQNGMVKDALIPYDLKGAVVKRIVGIVVREESVRKVVESTTTQHSRNDPDHPHHALELAVAVELWEQVKDLVPYKEKAKRWLELFHPTLKTNQTNRILELTNPNPEGGRPKKGV